MNLRWWCDSRFRNFCYQYLKYDLMVLSLFLGGEQTIMKVFSLELLRILQKSGDIFLERSPFRYSAHTFLINIGLLEWPKTSPAPARSQIKLPLSKQRALIIRPWRAGSLSYGCSGAHFASRIGPWGPAGAA